MINMVFVMVRISREIGGGQDFEYVNKAWIYFCEIVFLDNHLNISFTIRVNEMDLQSY